MFTYYSQNYAGIIGAGLPGTAFGLWSISGQTEFLIKLITVLQTICKPGNNWFVNWVKTDF